MNLGRAKSSHHLELRKKLFENTYFHVQALLGEANKEVLRYEQDYKKQFKKHIKKINKNLFFKEIERFNILYLGDFHALRQSQKTHYRILKSLNIKNAIIAIECIHEKHQNYVNEFLSGMLSEKDFLKSVQWQKNWGFPWENYKAIFRFAQKNKLKILALNTDAKSLKTRDRNAAKIISQSIMVHPQQRHLVIFGDLHLSIDKIPKFVATRIPKKYKYCMIFQNSESLYFSTIQKSKSEDIIKISNNQFCINNTPPWVKWQNYLIYLESQLYNKFDDSNLDINDYVAQLLDILVQDLGVQSFKNNIEIYTKSDAALIHKIKQNYNYEEIRIINNLIKANETFYLKKIQVGHLGKHSVNQAAELAMSLVHNQLAHMKKEMLDFLSHFTQHIWIFAVSYFGSKLINPNRKTDTFLDIKNSIQNRSTEKYALDVMKIVLNQKMNEKLYLLSSNRSFKTYKVNNKLSYRAAAKILGGMLGEKMYHGLESGLLSRKNLLRLFSKKVDEPNFDMVYFEILEIIENLPDPFLSKNEKI